MKYGIRREEKGKEAKRRWKTAMENEMRSLKFEVAILKEQVQNCIEKRILLPTENLAQPSTSKGCEKNVNNPFNDNNNNDKNNNVPMRGAFLQFPDSVIKENLYLLKLPDCQVPPPTTCSSLFGVPGGTRLARYRSTPDSPCENLRLQCITAMPEYSNSSLEELRAKDYQIAHPHHHKQFVNYGLNKSAGTLTGTVVSPYRSSWTYESVTTVNTVTLRHNCITDIPEYRDKSFEELRLEDYILRSFKFPDKVWPKGGKRVVPPKSKFKKQQFCWTNVFPPMKNKGFTTNPQASWPNSITAQSLDAASDRFQESTWRPPNWFLQSKPKFLFAPTVANENSEKVSEKFPWSRPPNCSSDSAPKFLFTPPTVKTADNSNTRHEELLNQVLSEVKKLDLKMSSMNSSLSVMGLKISDFNSRMSVMDSRLSAIDMFVTMERVNKKWLGLEPRLASMESTPVSKDGEDNKTETTTIGTTPQKEETNLSGVEEKFESPSRDETFTSSSESTNTTVNENKNESTNTSFNCSSAFPQKMDISEASHLSVRSLPALKTEELVTDMSLNKTDQTCDDSKQNLSLSMLEVVELEEKCGQQSEILASSGRKSLSTNQLCEDDDKKDIKTNTVEAIGNLSGENSLNQHEDNILTSTNIIETVNPIDLKEKKSELDADVEFVMIEKTDLADLVTGEESKEQNSFGSGASGQHFTIFNNITEYLEINLGKQKDAIYEFGFEAKPDHFSFSSKNELSDVNDAKKPSEINTSARSEQNDSFCCFVNQLVNSNSAKLNQSSPLVMKQTHTEDVSGEISGSLHSSKPP